MEVLHSVDAELFAGRRCADKIELIKLDDVKNVGLLKQATMGNFGRDGQIYTRNLPATRSEGAAPTETPTE